MRALLALWLAAGAAAQTPAAAPSSKPASAAAQPTPSKTPAQALAEAEAAERRLYDDRQRFEAALRLARLAWKAGDKRKTKRYAHRLLQQAGRFHKDPLYGDAVYTGHELVGLLDLQKGDVDRAERQLADSAKNPGSPALAKDGPDMTLAKALLARGRQESVSKFLASCEKLWPAGKPKLESWRADVDGGRTPDFDGLLRL